MNVTSHISRLPHPPTLEGQKRLGAQPSEQGLHRPRGVPRLGVQLHPGQGEPHTGTRPQGNPHRTRVRLQRDVNALASQADEPVRGGAALPGASGAGAPGQGGGHAWTVGSG